MNFPGTSFRFRSSTTRLARRCLITVAVESLAGLGSNCWSEFIEGRRYAELQGSIGGEFVVAAALTMGGQAMAPS
jgi:hypothetical protein